MDKITRDSNGAIYYNDVMLDMYEFVFWLRCTHICTPREATLEIVQKFLAEQKEMQVKK